MNRECFSNTWFIYELCLFTFFMNDIEEFNIPIRLNDESLSEFIERNFNDWYTSFVQHWSMHHQTNPCPSKDGQKRSHCMSAIILDGIQTIKRPSCSNKNRYIQTDEFPDRLYIGCGNAPFNNSTSCCDCSKQTILKDSETLLSTNDDHGIYDDPVTGCNVSRQER